MSGTAKDVSEGEGLIPDRDVEVAAVVSLERVADLAREWFRQHVAPPSTGPGSTP